MQKRQMKVVKLIEPEMCNNCRFSQKAVVELENGSKETVIHCKRLDCDNWDYSSAEKVTKVDIEHHEK